MILPPPSWSAQNRLISPNPADYLIHNARKNNYDNNNNYNDNNINDYGNNNNNNDSNNDNDDSNDNNLKTYDGSNMINYTYDNKMNIKSRTHHYKSPVLTRINHIDMPLHIRFASIIEKTRSGFIGNRGSVHTNNSTYITNNNITFENIDKSNWFSHNKSAGKLAESVFGIDGIISPANESTSTASDRYDTLIFAFYDIVHLLHMFRRYVRTIGISE